MSRKSNVWNVFWQVVKFILTLGLSHIAKREDRVNNDSTENGGAKT